MLCRPTTRWHTFYCISCKSTLQIQWHSVLVDWVSDSAEAEFLSLIAIPQHWPWRCHLNSRTVNPQKPESNLALICTSNSVVLAHFNSLAWVLTALPRQSMKKQRPSRLESVQVSLKGNSSCMLHDQLANWKGISQQRRWQKPLRFTLEVTRAQKGVNDGHLEYSCYQERFSTGDVSGLASCEIRQMKWIQQTCEANGFLPKYLWEYRRCYYDPRFLEICGSVKGMCIQINGQERREWKPVET